MAVIAMLALTQSMSQVVQEYEWGFLMRDWGAPMLLEPGLHFASPGKVTRIDRRTHLSTIEGLELHTGGDRAIKVSFIMFVRVVDPERTVLFEGDWRSALMRIAHDDLPRSLGHWTAEDAYWERARLGREMRDVLHRETSAMGVAIEGVHVEEVLRLV